MRKVPLIEFVYEKGCPNIKPTRQILLQAFSKMNVKPHWQEWEVNDSSSPQYVRQYGSPTILVNGIDIDELKDSNNANQCRLYTQTDNVFSGVPPLEKIINAIQKAKTVKSDLNQISGSSLKITAIPVMLLALLPKVVCPFCWPLYTGMLGALGVNFINYTPYLFPLLTLFLILTIAGLIIGAKDNKKYKPVYLGVISSVFILLGKTLFGTNVLIYSGIIGLMVSVIWQSRIKSIGNRGSCAVCENETKSIT
jgi:mercuric ion transport protein